jgi:hypothetical protein
MPTAVGFAAEEDATTTVGVVTGADAYTGAAVGAFAACTVVGVTDGVLAAVAVGTAAGAAA